MSTVLITLTARAPLESAKIELLAKRAARYVRQLKKSGNIEITTVSENVIRQLNRRYRGLNRPTDVLSFGWGEANWPGSRATDETMGQIYLSPAYIRRQAKRFKVTPREEFSRMLVHGLLHLAGYDHQTPRQAKRMFALQEKIIG